MNETIRHAAMTFAFVCVALPWQVRAADSCNSLEIARWLLGDWVSHDDDRTITESWTKRSDSTFEGQGVTMQGTTRIQGESLRLVQMEQGVFYIAKVAHNPLPIAFELTQCAAQRLVFENNAHDFPKRLEYAARHADELTVQVSDGRDKGFTLVFRRAPKTP